MLTQEKKSGFSWVEDLTAYAVEKKKRLPYFDLREVEC